MKSFGPSASQQYPLYGPRSVRSDRERFRRDSIPLLSRANSLCVPGGRAPARGYILLARADYNKLNTYSTTFQLNLGDPRQADNIPTFRNLSIVQAQCVTRGLSTDPNALYLVELTDGRGILHNEWFQFPTTSFYNIRAPAYPQTFHPTSLNGGTTYTWSTLIENLWTQMVAFLGAFPGLPNPHPSGTPEGFWFVGTSAWQSLCDILDHLGLTVAVNLTSATPYTIVSDGAADPSLAALQTKYLTHLEDDLEYIDTGAGRVPKFLKILFRRRNSIYGTEETVRYDLPQWDMAPFYSVTTTAPVFFTLATGTHYIWSDFTVRYDEDGNPLAADTATERTTQYFDRIYSRASGYMRQYYTGALPFTTGSQLDAIRWAMDHRRNYSGWTTELIRGALPSEWTRRD